MLHLLSSRIDISWWINRLRYFFTPTRQYRSIDGIEAVFVPETFREFRRFRSFTGEEPIISDMLTQLSSEDTFYDIGANVGTHSSFAGQVARTVVAFEPHPETANRLKENLDRNGISATIYQLALSDHSGTAELVLPEETSTEMGSGEFSIVNAESSVKSWTVEMIPGDKLIDRDDLPTPDVVKIDVEGAELQVIKGLSTALTDVRVVYCEIHPQHVEEEDVFNALQSLGFDVERLGKREGGHSFLRGIRE